MLRFYCHLKINVIYSGVAGLTFRKDMYLASSQIYPRVGGSKRPLTALQERLIKKLGENAIPFRFDMPPRSPASVTIQPAPGSGQSCGIDYELKVFLGDAVGDKPQKQ